MEHKITFFEQLKDVKNQKRKNLQKLIIMKTDKDRERPQGHYP